MNIFHETNIFTTWLEKLRDMKGKARISARITSAKHGNFGDSKSVGEGVYEMRIHTGAGYRVYYAQEGQHVYLLISGGDKSSQTKDIVKAKEIWHTIKENQK